jgi:hypothetical protein
MKNKQKQSKESGKVQVSLLVAVILAAGGAGTWAQLQAAGATTSKEAAYGVRVNGNLGGYIDISENGDGTADISVVKTLPTAGGPVSLNAFDEAATDYSISARATGNSGNVNGTGTANAVLNGTLLSLLTFKSTPVIVEVDVAVDGTTEVESSFHQGLEASVNPYTGESSISRVRSIGTEYYGSTAGSFVFTVDGQKFYEEDNARGWVSIYSSRSLVRIH